MKRRKKKKRKKIIIKPNLSHNDWYKFTKKKYFLTASWTIFFPFAWHTSWWEWDNFLIKKCSSGSINTNSRCHGETHSSCSDSTTDKLTRPPVGSRIKDVLWVITCIWCGLLQAHQGHWFSILCWKGPQSRERMKIYWMAEKMADQI